MKQLALAATVFAVCIAGGVSAQNVSVIKQDKVTRIVQTLSADDMQGRASFTPGIEKAADFIVSEFEKNKLKPLPGNTGFKQTFAITRITPQQLNVTINGRTISPDSAFASSSHKQLQWQTGGTQQVVTIGEQDNFREVMATIAKQEKDALILVHPKHSNIFATYKRYMRRGSLTREPGKSPSNVFVLTDMPQLQNYSVAAQNKTEELQLTNVVGMIEGRRKDEFVVFSGHYDHIGTHTTIDGDSIANGADDDASGTTAMMLLADFYKKQRKPERTLIFVAFAAEEIGGYGSKYFSEQLNPDQIVAMFNIEMVGKPSKFGPNSAYLTGYEKSNLGELMQKRLKGTGYSIHPDPYPSQNLFYRSDNSTLARLGVPAHTISSVQIDQDKTYHTVKDEFEMLNMTHLTSMIRGIALGSYDVVFGRQTPTRVDKAQVQ